MTVFSRIHDSDPVQTWPCGVFTFAPKIKYNRMRLVPTSEIVMLEFFLPVESRENERVARVDGDCKKRPRVKGGDESRNTIEQLKKWK